MQVEFWIAFSIWIFNPSGLHTDCKTGGAGLARGQVRKGEN